MAATSAQRRSGNSRRHQPRSGPQRAQSRQRRRAGFAARRSQRPAHHQHVPEVALVGRSRARRLRKRQRRAGPRQIQRGDHRLFRRANGRHHDGLRPVPRQLPKDMRRLGRGKSNDRIGGKNRPGNSGGRSRPPASRKEDRQPESARDCPSPIPAPPAPAPSAAA